MLRFLPAIPEWKHIAFLYLLVAVLFARLLYCREDCMPIKQYQSNELPTQASAVPSHIIHYKRRFVEIGETGLYKKCMNLGDQCVDAEPQSLPTNRAAQNDADNSFYIHTPGLPKPSRGCDARYENCDLSYPE
jgi:hypothetical protein